MAMSREERGKLGAQARWGKKDPEAPTPQTATAVAEPPKPQPPKNNAEPTVQAPVKIRVDVPAHVFEKYKRDAEAVHRDVEEYIGDHLRQTVNQDHSGAGLWFSAEQASKLCRLTGRGSCNDAEMVLQRLQPLLQILVGDVRVYLDAQILERLKHIPRNRTVPEFIAKEALNGLRGSLGLSLR